MRKVIHKYKNTLSLDINFNTQHYQKLLGASVASDKTKQNNTLNLLWISWISTLGYSLHT